MQSVPIPSGPRRINGVFEQSHRQFLHMRASNVPSCDSSLTEAMFSFIRLRISTCTHSTASCGVRAPSFDRTTLRDSPSFPQTTRCTPCSSTDTRYGSLKSVPRAAYRIGASLGVAPRGVAFCIIFCTLSPYVANFASVSSLTPPNASNSSSTQFLFPRLFASFAPRAVAIASKRAKIASLARFLVSRGDDADAFDAVASSGSARIDRVVQGARTGRRAATPRRDAPRRAASRDADQWCSFRDAYGQTVQTGCAGVIFTERSRKKTLARGRDATRDATRVAAEVSRSIERRRRGASDR